METFAGDAANSARTEASTQARSSARRGKPPVCWQMSDGDLCVKENERKELEHFAF